jgi:DNA-binding IclR family transcriptional regulator
MIENTVPNDQEAGKGIERTAAILRVLGKNAGAGGRLTDIAADAQLSKSTAHRMLGALMRVGLVEQDAVTGLFHLGFDFFVLGAQAANRYGLTDIAEEAVTRLTERTADTVYLQAITGYEAICLERREGSFPIKTLTLAIGDRRPLGIGAGSLALLAALPDAHVTRAIEVNAARLASYPYFDTPTLWGLVERTRRQGFAFNEGLVIPGMCAVGVAIFNHATGPIGALSVAAIDSRMGAERQASIVGWLQAEKAAVEEKLNRFSEGLSNLGVRRLMRAP